MATGDGGKGNFAGTGGYTSGSTVAGNAGGYGNPSSMTGGVGGQTYSSMASGNVGGGFSGMGYANDAVNKTALAKAIAAQMNAARKTESTPGVTYQQVLAKLNKKKPVPAVITPPTVLPPTPPILGTPPLPQPAPRPPYGYYNPAYGDMYQSNPYSNAPYGGWTSHVPLDKDPSRVDGWEKQYPDSRVPRDSGQGTGPGGAFGGQDTPGGDTNTQGMAGASLMMAAPEAPIISPGPMGPGGQPMGNGFQWGARNLALSHRYNRPMQRRQQPMRRDQIMRAMGRVA